MSSTVSAAIPQALARVQAMARAIKADPALRSTRLIMLSSFGQRVPKDAAQQADLAACLAKPVRQAQLYDCIATVMHTASASAPTPASTGTSPAAARSWRGTRVLVVEDNVVNQRVAVRILEKLDCRADVAANGLEAVEALARSAYDCIFMDCQMPEMDGYEATAALRQRERRTAQHTPIIAMTANAMQGDRERCLAAGMDDYIGKPIKSGELLAMLRKWVRPAETTTLR